MEAPPPVGAGEPGALHALDLVAARLCGNRFGVRMHRMRVLAALQDSRGVDVVRAVEGDHQRGVAGQALQQVHAVTHGAGLRRIADRRQVRVPRRPCLAVARQQARIGMQHGVVGLVADRAEDVALGIAGIGSSRCSAWSLWQASTTWSKRSLPPSQRTLTPWASRAMHAHRRGRAAPARPSARPSPRHSAASRHAPRARAPGGRSVAASGGWP
jgi:hypothetical protein